MKAAFLCSKMLNTNGRLQKGNFTFCWAAIFYISSEMNQSNNWNALLKNRKQDFKAFCKKLA
jgi:hypothetical protein